MLETLSAPSWRLFGILWVLGAVGTATLWLVPLPQGMVTPLPPMIIKLIGVVQALVMMSIALVIGHFLAPRLGLSVPALGTWIRGGNGLAALLPQLIPAVVGGLVAAGFITLYALIQIRFMPEVLNAGTPEMPIMTRLFYGGMVEELLMRWGLLSLLLWIGWRVFQGGNASPSLMLFWGVNIVVALVFGAGHLPAAITMGFTNPMIMSAIVVFNALAALVYGWLFYRYGLESAMIAHMTTHTVNVFIFFPLITRIFNVA